MRREESLPEKKIFFSSSLSNFGKNIKRDWFCSVLLLLFGEERV